MLSQEEQDEWDITLLVQNNFIRCYWTKTWNWSESFKVKVTLKKARKEIELYIGRGTGFVGNSFYLTSKEC
jgi:hypothetical protein